MLFKDILDKKTILLGEEFKKLFFDVLANQTHKGDLRLVELNGFYHPDVYKWDNIPGKKNPYMIGPNTEGYSEDLHYRFIHQYRISSIFPEEFTEYTKKIAWEPNKKEEIDLLVENESISIQLEMLIYLKIWEADMTIKRFYQISRLLHGEAYDWHFKIKESNRDSKATAKRDDIIRKLVRDKFLPTFPALHGSFANAYKTQLRNSIAHSKYSFHGRHIHLNNAIEGDAHAQLEVISFDEWIDIFHDTIVIYNQYINFFNKAREFYGMLAEKNNLQAEIRIERKDPSITTEYVRLNYRPQFKDWH